MRNGRMQFCWIVALWLTILATGAHSQTYTDLFDLTQPTGSAPGNPNVLAQGQDGNLYSTMPSSFPGDGTVVFAPPSGAVSEIHYFQGTDGNSPASGLTLGLDGNFYGTTFVKTTAGSGEVFQVTPGGTVNVLYTFSNTTDGAFPWAPPIMASDGNLYGVTQGTTPVAYKITMPAGTFSVLANLPSNSTAPLIIGTDGNFYGVTIKGGTFNQGTAFQLTKKGALKILYSFGANGTDGTSPGGSLLQAADGKLYGGSYWGGASGNGTIFSMTTAGGSYKILHNFNGTDGSHPPSALVQGSDNFLYGATVAGGTVGGNGVFFKINTTGTTYSVLHNFDGKTSGGSPDSNVLLHTNGTIYGWGTVGPKEGVLYSMNVGLKPFATLVIVTSGKVGTKVGILGQGFTSATGVQFGTGPGTFTVVSDTYMTAAPAAGATTGKVTVLEPGGNLVTPQKFKVTPTIKSFAPTSGPVGTSVTITGMSLTQTTAVKFGTVAATFTVNSDTQVTATVPTGAVTAKISVTTQGGGATSATTFTVN